MPGLCDHEPGPGAHDAGALAQDDLELAQIAPLAGELTGALGGLDLVEADDAPLRLRDGLLGDDDDVAGAQLRRAGDHRAQVVAGADLGQALDREDGDHAGGSPVTEMPAWAL